MMTVVPFWSDIWVKALLNDSNWLRVLENGVVGRDVHKWGLVSSEIPFGNDEHSLKNFWLLFLNFRINIVKILSPDNYSLFRLNWILTTRYFQRTLFSINLLNIPVFGTNYIQTSKQGPNSWKTLCILWRTIVGHQHWIIPIKSYRSQILSDSEHKFLCRDFLNYWLRIGLLRFIHISNRI